MSRPTTTLHATRHDLNNRTNTWFWHTRKRLGPWSKYARDVRVRRPLAPTPVCVLCDGPAVSASWHDPAPFCDACVARLEGT